MLVCNPGIIRVLQRSLNSHELLLPWLIRITSCSMNVVKLHLPVHVSKVPEIYVSIMFQSQPFGHHANV
jgi:hypothetical protein